MVVEDDISSRNALLLLLKHYGFDIIPAGTVAEAMMQLESQPSVMILDLMLPDGNGSEVLEHVRATRLPIQVAVATGAGDWRAMVDEVRLRPDAMFVKPLDFPRLVAWLETACAAD
jgi:DNA-binding NtrC family response regulator